MRLTEDWKTSSDNENLVGAVLIDVCIPHGVLVVKLHNTKLANFTDDNTIYPNNTEMETLPDILETES